MLMKRTDERRQALEAIRTAAMRAQPGDILAWSTLYDLTGIQHHQTITRMVIMVNKSLLQDQRYLVNVRTVGYRLSTPDDQISHIDQRRLRGYRQQRIGLKVAAIVNPMELSEGQRQQLTRMVDKMEKAAAMLHWNSLRARASAEKTLLLNRQTETKAAALRAMIDEFHKRFGELSSS